MQWIRHVLRSLTLLNVLAAGASATAQPAWPVNPIRIVVPGPAGSSFDNAARAVAEPMSKALGVPVIVDNKPGATTTIGSDMVAKSVPDGHTLLLVLTPSVQAPHLYTRLPYDALTSFTPVSHLFDAPLWFAVSSAVPARSVKEFITQAKAQPAGSSYSYASAGNGSTPHLYGVILGRVTGTELLHVPYRGMSPAVVDTAGGMVSSVFASYSDLVGHERAGKLRVLASTGTQRTRLTPSLPTLSELGFKGFESVGFGGLVAPAGTPKPVVDRLHDVLHQILQQAEVRARLHVLGLEAAGPSSTADFGRLMRAQSALWKGVIRDADIKLD
jgi:tripartite-type tricarboxylate transporter receptor subunit TctC